MTIWSWLEMVGAAVCMGTVLMGTVGAGRGRAARASGHGAIASQWGSRRGSRPVASVRWREGSSCALGSWVMGVPAGLVARGCLPAARALHASYQGRQRWHAACYVLRVACCTLRVAYCTSRAARCVLSATHGLVMQTLSWAERDTWLGDADFVVGRGLGDSNKHRVQAPCIPGDPAIAGAGGWVAWGVGGLGVGGMLTMMLRTAAGVPGVPWTSP
jgi:hypothetical protein